MNLHHQNKRQAMTNLIKILDETIRVIVEADVNSRNVMARNMDNETFEKEIAMCKKLSQENGGKCNWGTCDTCGVIPLLHKLAKGTFYEKEEEVKQLKRDALQ